MDSTRYLHIIWLPLLAYLIWFLDRFAWFDGLSSIANDSVNYLVMARHYSPWLPETPANLIAWQYQDFPPLFPLLLAVTGAAHSLYWSHVLVTMLGLVLLVPMYFLARGRVHSSFIALLLMIAFALTPGYLLALQGILSEALYLLLSLIFLIIHERRRISISWIILAGCLLGMVLLTRTIGFALWLALLVVLVIRLLNGNKHYRSGLLTLSVSLLLFIIINGILGPETESHYSVVLMQSLGAGQSLFELLVTNLTGLVDAWRSYWLIYWHDELAAQNYITLAMGALAILATLGNIARKPDDLLAWYVLIYLLVLVVWPHPGQMVRLIMPVVPLLTIIFMENLMVMNLNAKWQPYRKMVAGFLLSLMIVITVPAHAFMHERIGYADDRGLQPLSEFFRIIPIDEAWQDLVIQQQMLKDFSTLPKYINANDLLLYYVPAYSAVLSSVRTERLDIDQDAEIMKSNIILSQANYLMLTYYHPRKKRKGVNALIGNHFRDITRQVHCSTHMGIPVSCLYRIVR